MDRRRPRTRIVLLAFLAALWLGAVLARLIYLQIYCYGEYQARARRQQQRVVEVSPRRGGLYDRNLHELAMSVSLDSCFAVPVEIADPAMVARLLAGVLETPQEEIEQRLSSSKSFVWIARKLPPEKTARIQALNLRGVYFQKEFQRSYPMGSLAAHLLGYVDIDDRGLGGIEYAFDEQLRIRGGKMLVMADARRRWYERRGGEAGTAASLVLTIDENIQYIAEKELAAAIARTQARAGTIIVQDPNTGELLAVANWPVFNPNTASTSPADARIDRAVSALYEPGSTFKIVTVAAALEEGITRADDLIDCQMGAIFIGKHRIRDHKPFGVLSVSQVISNSSDIGAIKLGLRLGAPKFYQYIRAFGFGAPTGIELPGETRGLLRRVEAWSPISIGAISMGQEIGVTPVQLVSAISAIANGGMLLRPRVVREMRRGAQMVSPRQDLSSAATPRRVIRPDTAATMRQMLEGVVLVGTGRLAKLEGYTAGGKTGTAQKIDPSSGRYSLRDYIASFVGFAPVNTPAITVLVVLDSPVGGHHGGEVAAPFFRTVAQQTLAYLRVTPDVPLTSTAQSSQGPREKVVDDTDLSDFDPAQILDSREQSAPQAGEESSGKPSQTTATLVLESEDGVSVPAFAGQTVRAFIEECVRLGLNPVPVGSGVAVEQVPQAGARVRPGSRIVVRFANGAGYQTVAQKGN
jgi:cell division protein FtsI (penicillin-binding protein 3)